MGIDIDKITLKELDEQLSQYKRKATKRKEILEDARNLYEGSLRAIVLLTEVKRRKAVSGKFKLSHKQLTDLKNDITEQMLSGEVQFNEKTLNELSEITAEKFYAQGNTRITKNKIQAGK